MSVMKTGKILVAKNPIIDSDFPDPDIIRVGDTYYIDTPNGDWYAFMFQDRGALGEHLC